MDIHRNGGLFFFLESKSCPKAHQNTLLLEDHSRRNNLRINGIKEKVGESWEDCEAEVEKLFREKLDIEDKIIIERAHRAVKKQKTAKKINQGQSSVFC